MQIIISSLLYHIISWDKDAFIKISQMVMAKYDAFEWNQDNYSLSYIYIVHSSLIISICDKMKGIKVL